jgi:hypothetical protein
MIRQKKGVKQKDMESAVKSIFALLYLDRDKKSNFYNPDKEWDSAADYLEEIVGRINSVVEWTPDRKGKK